MRNNRETITMPAPQTAPEPTTKPTTTEPGTKPDTKPGKDNDPWNVPSPNQQPGPKA